MSRKFFGAASIAALMAAGLAACGQETRTAYDETDEQERSEYAEQETETPDTFAGAPMPSDDARLAQPAAVPNAGGAAAPTGEAVAAAIADVRVRSDAEQAAVAAFRLADANGDGVLDQDEYLTIALAAESGFAEAAPAYEQGEGDIGAPEPYQTRTAEADPAAVEAAFAEVAGETGEATKDDLRAAFLARFEQADADGDGQLDEQERIAFAALIVGVADDPQP